jgi:hypothetical protein
MRIEGEEIAVTCDPRPFSCEQRKRIRTTNNNMHAIDGRHQGMSATTWRVNAAGFCFVRSQPLTLHFRLPPVATVILVVAAFSNEHDVR